MSLIEAGADREKFGGKPNRILLELWQQLKPEQQFQPLRPKRQRSDRVTNPVCLSARHFAGEAGEQCLSFLAQGPLQRTKEVHMD